MHTNHARGRAKTGWRVTEPRRGVFVCRACVCVLCVHIVAAAACLLCMLSASPRRRRGCHPVFPLVLASATCLFAECICLYPQLLLLLLKNSCTCTRYCCKKAPADQAKAGMATVPHLRLLGRIVVSSSSRRSPSPPTISQAAPAHPPTRTRERV